MFFLLYIKLICSDPGEIPVNTISFVNKLIEKNKDLTKYCHKCFIKKERDSKHCIICNKCFLNFDHHCYWINKCVANDNYRIFVLFLLESFIFLSFILSMGILGLISAIQNKIINIDNIYYIEFLKFLFNIGSTSLIKFVHIGLNIFLIILSLFFLIPVAILMVFHIYRYCTEFKDKRKTNSSKSELFDDKVSLMTFSEE